MDIYQHDSPRQFRFVLGGELTEADAQRLQWAWETARSILGGKEMTVDVTGIVKLDLNGINVLSQMREAGARIVAARPPGCEELLRFLDYPTAAPGGLAPKRHWAMRILEAARLIQSQ